MYEVWCDGKHIKMVNSRVAIIRAKQLASKSVSKRAGIYKDGQLIRTITINDLV